MALSVDSLIQWRDGLIEARLSGTRIYRDQNGESVTYGSDAEMARAIASADAMIRVQCGQPVTTVRFITSKGL